MATSPPPQVVVWHGMRLAWPREWEIVRHSVKPERGHLTVVDRRAERLALSWQRVEREPDLQRMLSDYASRGGGDVTRLPRINRWLALRRAGKQEITRAIRYEKKVQRLVELVLPWPSECDEALERSILESFAQDSANGPSRWWAFGVHVQAPVGWTLAKVQVEPARAVFRFGRKSGEATVTRRGAADDWYDGRLQDLLTAEIGAHKAQFRAATFRGRGPGRGREHTACAAVSREPGLRWQRLLGRARQRRDLLWHCAADHAVYQVTLLVPDRDALQPDAFEVHCCG